MGGPQQIVGGLGMVLRFRVQVQGSARVLTSGSRVQGFRSS